MTNNFLEFVKMNKIKLIIVLVIILILFGLFMVGKTSGGKDINYIPV